MKTPTRVRLCRWCLRNLTRRADESASAFARRRHCDRSCAASSQNHRRAREAS